MIDELTQPLTPAEENLVPGFVDRLIKRKGKPVTLEVMRKAIIELSEVQMLKIIHHIRVKGLVPLLVHDEKGYWVAQSRQEVDAAVKRIRAFEDMMWKERNSLLQQMEVSWLK